MPETNVITSYHAHVYYHPETREVAEQVRKELGDRFEVQLGRWHDQLVGPHTRSMYQVAFAVNQFE
ncbi:MAG: DOPA 4,5-dioxygenase family protein, partial [Pseudanabaena sp.]